jgi:hypothetical protein
MPLNLVDNTLFIDNTTLEYYTTCPRKGRYRLIDRRETSDTKSALGFGDRIHRILEVFYKHSDAKLRETECRSALELAFSDWVVDDDDFRTKAVASNWLTEYLAQYGHEQLEILTVGDRRAIELSFATPLGQVGGINIVWTGRIDLLYERESRLYIMDHKTTSMMGPSYFKEYEHSSQVLGYMWSVRELIGRAPHAFVVNALGIRKPTKTGKGIELERQIVMPDVSLVDEWHDTTLNIVAEIIHNSETDIWPKHYKACVGKYGACEYFNVCTLPPEQRNMMLGSGNFKPVTWTPLT